MAPRKRRTTSATRGKNKGKGASKVTGKTPQSRANRQKASNARVTKGGQGGGRGRVTNASQRTSTGRARVTGGSRPALPPGKKGGSIVKSNPRRTAAKTKAGRAAAGTKGRTVRTGQKTSAIVKQTRAQKIKGSIRTGSYAQDIAKLKRLLRKGGAVALRQARALAKAIGPRALKAAPGLVLGGALVGSAGRPNQRTMSKLGLLKAAEYKTPFNQGKPKPKKPYYGPGGNPSGSGEGQAQQRKPKPKPRNTNGTSRSGRTGGGSRGGAGTPPVAKRTAPKPKPKKLTDKQRMVGKSSAERLAVWAKANRKMIEKSGTKKQREILANALKKKK